MKPLLATLFALVPLSDALAQDRPRPPAQKPPRSAPARPPARAPEKPPQRAQPPARGAPARPPRDRAALEPVARPPAAAAAAVPAPEASAKESAEEALAREEAAFGLCDGDRNGWISFREARGALELDRGAYATYDRDRDGRITRAEFAVRYQEVFAQTGRFRTPRAPAGANRAIPRTPDQLLRAYDLDADAALDPSELESVLTDYRREQIPLETILEKLDRDGSGRIEGGEILELAQVVRAASIGAASRGGTSQPPRTLEDLFGGPVEPSVLFDATQRPPRFPGPATHFRRLDLDGDGSIRLDDLRRLQATLQLSVRANAVLASLDRDEDGGLSEAELLAAMGK
jgi:Ca2+-binding EF-hand superfamily protein